MNHTSATIPAPPTIAEGNRLADIVVRVYKDHVHDKRRAARLAAWLTLRQRGTSLDSGERDVLERVRRGELSCDSSEVDFFPKCFVTVRGGRSLRDPVDKASPLVNSFGEEFRRELQRLETRLWKRRIDRYERLGGPFDAAVMDQPLWDYVREWVAPRLGVEDAEARLLMFARRAAEGRPPRRDPVANELLRLYREGTADELLRDVWRLYEVQAIDLKLPEVAEKPGGQQNVVKVPAELETIRDTLRAVVREELRPSRKVHERACHAWTAYQYALQQPGNVTVADAHRWLEDHLNEVTKLPDDYEIPKLSTFGRYVRKAREFVEAEQRRGGRSIVLAKDADYPRP